MSLSDKELLELHELCGALADETISTEQHQRLAAWLQSSEEARQFYVRSMALSASLFQYAGEMLAEAPDSPAPPKSKIIRFAKWWAAVPLAAAAVFMLAFWIGNRSADPGNSASPDLESEETVAHLSGARDCRWGGAAPSLGDDLRSGQQLDLVSGAAEITFDSGAQLVVEAPSSIEVTSAWNAVLHRGTLKANVPAEAVGFRITNPAVDVVDLGTEFSMVTDDNGGTEVFVHKGAVETSDPEGAPSNHKRLVLREKQARRFARSGVTDVRDRETKLAKLGRKQAFDRPAKAFGYAHWNFDELKGDTLSAQTFGLPEGSYGMKLSPSSSLANLQTPGKWGNALNLDGSTTLTANVPGLGRRVPRTIAFWTRIPPDSDLSSAGPAVAWLYGGKETRPFAVGWNRNPALGAFGALQAIYGKRTIIGATPLRDGQWHHVAVVLTPNRKNEVGMQIKEYTDGRLESAAAKSAIKRRGNGARREVDPFELAEDVLAIGGTSASAEHFRGSLDELYLCDRALAPREIAHLMRKNQALTPELLAAE